MGARQRRAIVIFCSTVISGALTSLAFLSFEAGPGRALALVVVLVINAVWSWAISRRGR
jgi:hypothetical protein